MQERLIFLQQCSSDTYAHHVQETEDYESKSMIRKQIFINCFFFGQLYLRKRILNHQIVTRWNISTRPGWHHSFYNFNSYLNRSIIELNLTQAIPLSDRFVLRLSL